MIPSSKAFNNSPLPIGRFKLFRYLRPPQFDAKLPCYPHFCSLPAWTFLPLHRPAYWTQSIFWGFDTSLSCLKPLPCNVFKCFLSYHNPLRSSSHLFHEDFNSAPLTLSLHYLFGSGHNDFCRLLLFCAYLPTCVVYTASSEVTKGLVFFPTNLAPFYAIAGRHTKRFCWLTSFFFQQA